MTLAAIWEAAYKESLEDLTEAPYQDKNRNLVVIDDPRGKYGAELAAGMPLVHAGMLGGMASGIIGGAHKGGLLGAMGGGLTGGFIGTLGGVMVNEMRASIKTTSHRPNVQDMNRLRHLMEISRKVGLNNAEHRELTKLLVKLNKENPDRPLMMLPRQPKPFHSGLRQGDEYGEGVSPVTRALRPPTPARTAGNKFMLKILKMGKLGGDAADTVDNWVGRGVGLNRSINEDGKRAASQAWEYLQGDEYGEAGISKAYTLAAPEIPNLFKAGPKHQPAPEAYSTFLRGGARKAKAAGSPGTGEGLRARMAPRQ